MNDEDKPAEQDPKTSRADLSESEEVRKARRKTLNRVLVGSGVVASAPLSGSWTRPVINTVVMPAHAQTSPGGDDDPGMLTMCTFGPAGSMVVTEIVANPDDTSSIFTSIVQITELVCTPV